MVPWRLPFSAAGPALATVGVYHGAEGDHRLSGSFLYDGDLDRRRPVQLKNETGLLVGLSEDWKAMIRMYEPWPSVSGG